MQNIEDLAILTGLLLTDGCVSSSKFIVFHNKSEVMHGLFKSVASSTFGKVHFTERFEINGTKRTQITSKVLVKKILQICKLKTFRRKQFENGEFPQVRLPKFILNLPKATVLKFLKTVFTADGSVSLSARWHKRNEAWEIRRRIELSCKHPDLRNDFMKLLVFVGFSPRTSGENITLEKKNDILKFASEVRFVNGVKVGGDSKFWRGFEKNQVLNIALKTLRFTKSDLESFATKEQVMNFLKSLN